MYHLLFPLFQNSPRSRRVGSSSSEPVVVTVYKGFGWRRSWWLWDCWRKQRLMASLRFAPHAGFKAADFLYSRGEHSWCSNSQVVGWMMWELTSAFKHLRVLEDVWSVSWGSVSWRMPLSDPIRCQLLEYFRLPFCSGFQFVSLITSGCWCPGWWRWTAVTC